MTIHVAIYARTSPDCPISAEDQVERLRTVAAERDWSVAQVFIDRPTTIRKGVERRPGEAALLDVIRSGTIDKVLVFGIDRVGRSLVELVNFLETCRTARVGQYLHEQGMGTGINDSLSLFDVAGMMAFHLRQSRRDRFCVVRRRPEVSRSDLVGHHSVKARWTKRSVNCAPARVCGRRHEWPEYWLPQRRG